MHCHVAHCYCHVRCEKQCKSTLTGQGSYTMLEEFENTAFFSTARPTVHNNVMKMEVSENTLQTRGI